MQLGYDYDKSFLVINRQLTKEIFLDKCGVENGYSLDMFTRMYNSIFSELLDIEREYEKYYAFEYSTLKEFLYKKYNLPYKDIDYLITEKSKNKDYVIFLKDHFSYGDYSIIQFAFGETMHDRIIDILTLQK